MEEQLLSVAEVATLLRWRASTIYRKAATGKIPGSVKLGGSVRFRQSVIEGWIAGSGRDALKNAGGENCETAVAR